MSFDLGTSPTSPAPTSGEQAQMRAALGLEIGTDVAAHHAQLALLSGMALPFVVAFKNVTVLTSGAPADIASVTLPDWLTRYVVFWTTGVRTIAETADGTLAGATFMLRSDADGGGLGIATQWSGPTGTSTAVVANGTNTSVPSITSTGSLFLRQTANSANAGTISVYALIVPFL